MPIRPENRDRYPPDWPQIRWRILERAKHRCEKCGVDNHAWGYREAGQFYPVNKQLAIEAVRSGREWVKPPFVLGGHRIIEIVLTIAHVGLPAKLPVQFHVTGSAETNKVVEVIGFLMPPGPEGPEWQHMMHRRTLADLGGSHSTMSARFAIALPSGVASGKPRRAIAHQSSAVSPEWIILTSWRLVAEPPQAARIAAEAAACPDVVPADAELLAAPLADAFAEPPPFDRLNASLRQAVEQVLTPSDACCAEILKGWQQITHDLNVSLLRLAPPIPGRLTPRLMTDECTRRHSAEHIFRGLWGL